MHSHTDGQDRRAAPIAAPPCPPARVRALRYCCRMPSFATDQMPHAPRTVRLKTLITLRWFAVIGQAITVFIVYYWLEFDLPIAACLTVIALSAWLNVALRMHFGNVQRLAPGPVAWLIGVWGWFGVVFRVHLGNVQRLEPGPVAWLLAGDIAQLTVLMVLTGG